jgi:sec-independent protein translocase protein TatA
MGSLGPIELLVIMAIALIVFGPKKLPEIGRSIGNAMREFNKARNDFMETIHSEIDRPEPAVSAPSDTASYYSGGVPDESPAARSLEYPEPLDADSADALPYGADFYAAEGDSQPSFRTAQPETTATTAASAGAPGGEGKA